MTMIAAWKKHGPRSWFGYLNFFLLQFVCIRLQRTVNEHDHSIHERWDIIGPIVPMTGWRGRYIWMLPKGWRLNP